MWDLKSQYRDANPIARNRCLHRLGHFVCEGPQCLEVSLGKSNRRSTSIFGTTKVCPLDSGRISKKAIA